MSGRPLIFISIASYRDSQLIPTIEDCLAKAARPDNLRFGICWQNRDDEPSLPFANDSRFRILDVDWRESRGCCWARAECQKLYDGEPWMLQIDSHHRFVPGWDLKLLDHIGRTDSARPILSGFTPNFSPAAPLDSYQTEPVIATFKDFGSNGFQELFAQWNMSTVVPEWRTRREPVRGRFITAGFIFAQGQFIEDVPYDPMILFHGEEVTLSIRAFTHGFDVFYPTEVMLWHLYTGMTGASKVRPFYADDHTKANGVDVDWWQRQHASNGRVKLFLDAPWIGPFGCGTKRTFDEYETFAGINCARQCTTDYTRRFGEPPNPPLPADWADRVSYYECQVNLRQSDIADDCTVLILFLWDGSRQLILKRQLGLETFTCTAFPNIEVARTYRVTFGSQEAPASWRVQAYSQSRGWKTFEGASPRAWVSTRRTSPFETMDWAYEVRRQIRQRAEHETADAIEHLLSESISARSKDGGVAAHTLTGNGGIDQGEPGVCTTVVPRELVERV